MKRSVIVTTVGICFFLQTALLGPIGGIKSGYAAAKKKDDKKKEEDDGQHGNEPPPLTGEAKKLFERTRGMWDDEPVEAAIKKGVEYLYSMQNADGSFGKKQYGHIKSHCWNVKQDNYKYQTPAIRQRLMGTEKMKLEPWPGAMGTSAIAVYALLKAGEDIHNDKIKKGLQFLMTHDNYGVYSIGLRCNTWVAAEKYQRGKYMKYLRHDATRLIYSIHRQTGGWNYSLWEDSYHNSPAQYGILGVWGYQMLGGEIPGNFWPLAIQYWVKGQLSNGAWAYQPAFKGGGGGHGQERGSMSAAGLASMFVCLDAMLRAKYVKCEGGALHPTIVKGLNWFHREFTNTMVGKTPACGGGHFCYYLYGVERVGRACGYKYFGNQDWFKLGALTLVKKQKDNGTWGNTPETGFALLFLVKGRHPVLFNKLDFGGDWNNRPRDIANLTNWMSRNYEREFNWQNVTLRVDPHEWHDAPILYISGSNKPNFSEEQIKKLRTYVYQGGTIFSCTECGGKGFKEGIREIYKKAFPRYEMRKLTPDHDIYSARIHAPLNGKPSMSIISNGSRPLVIHTDEDVARSWQMRTSSTQKNTFRFGVNLSRYIVGSYLSLLPRGKSYWPYPPASPGTPVTVARVKYGGNYNPEPLSLTALSRRLGKDESTSIDEKTVMADKLPGCGAKIAVMTGTDSVSLSAAHKAGIKKFVEDGGTIIIDSAGGSKKFYISMHKHLRAMFGASSIKPISTSSPVFSRSESPLKKAKYRVASRKRISSAAAKLQTIKVGGREAVILSREDIVSGMLGFHSGVIDGYEPETAYTIMRNLVMSAK